MTSKGLQVDFIQGALCEGGEERDRCQGFNCKSLLYVDET